MPDINENIRRSIVETIAITFESRADDASAAEDAMNMIDGAFLFLARRCGARFAAETAYRFGDHYACQPNHGDKS